MNGNLIGICGYAKTGKDTLCSTLDKIAKGRTGGAEIIKGSFAAQVRLDLDSFFMKKLNISAFTEDPEEKKLVRPMLLAWGTDVMRNQINVNHWVEKVGWDLVKNRAVGATTVITDVRFENELQWVHDQGGVVIWVSRDGVGPLNKDEEKYTKPLYFKCKYRVHWNEFNDIENGPVEFISEFMNENNLWHLITKI